MSKQDQTRAIASADPDILRGDDGHFIFWPSENRGAFEAWHLRLIADELDRRNAPIVAEIERLVA